MTDYDYHDAHGGIAYVEYPAAGGQSRERQNVTYVARRARYKNKDGNLIRSPSNIHLTRTVSYLNQRQTIDYESGHWNLLPGKTTSDTVYGVDPVATSYYYDHVGNVRTVNGPKPGDHDKVKFYYDAARRPTTVIGIDPDGSGPLNRTASRTVYHEDGRIDYAQSGHAPSLNDPGGFVALTTSAKHYDTYGRLTGDRFETDAGIEAAVHYVYDPAGRLQCTIQRMHALGSEPPVACAVGSGTPKHRVTRGYYDRAGRIYQVTRGYGTGAAVSETMGYHAGGQLRWSKDAEGNTTHYDIDGHGRTWRVRYPEPDDGAQSSYTDYERTYYVSGTNLIDKVRQRDGSVIDYAYDAIGRTENVFTDGDEDVSFTYDGFHRLKRIRSQGRTLTYGYDPKNRLNAETGSLGTTSYDFDIYGQVERVTYPGAGDFHVTYDHNVAGAVTHIREKGAQSGVGVLATYAYDQLGRRTSLTRGNGVRTTYGFDAGAQLNSLAFDLPNHKAYNRTVSFARNAAGQIVKATNNNAPYDPVVTIEDIVASFDDLNRLTAVGQASTTHDDLGNLTHDGQDAYAFDGLSRLTSVNGTQAKLAYDPAGRLYEERTPSSRLYLSYAGGALIGEHAGSGAVQRRYVHGPGADEPLVWYEGSGTEDKRCLP